MALHLYTAAAPRTPYHQRRKAKYLIILIREKQQWHHHLIEQSHLSALGKRTGKGRYRRIQNHQRLINNGNNGVARGMAKTWRRQKKKKKNGGVNR